MKRDVNPPHDWRLGPPRKIEGVWWATSTCSHCGATDHHPLDDEPFAPRCGHQPVHEHEWMDLHIVENTYNGHIRIIASQECIGCAAKRTVARARTKAPVGAPDYVRGCTNGGKYG